MSDLTDFLLARIAEDEAVARELRAEGTSVMSGSVLREPWHEGGPYHSDRWNPVRVLAECEAKRELITLHPEAVGDDLKAGAAWAYDEMLRRLALPYVDHPDYREEWRP